MKKPQQRKRQARGVTCFACLDAPAVVRFSPRRHVKWRALCVRCWLQAEDECGDRRRPGFVVEAIV